MTEADFEARYQDSLLNIEDAIEDSGHDLDYESVNDILTITCPNGSAIIITKQTAARQLWVAAKSGGFHFNLDPSGNWLCSLDGKPLPQMLSDLIQDQAGVEIEFASF